MSDSQNYYLEKVCKSLQFFQVYLVDKRKKIFHNSN